MKYAPMPSIIKEKFTEKYVHDFYYKLSITNKDERVEIHEDNLKVATDMDLHIDIAEDLARKQLEYAIDDRKILTSSAFKILSIQHTGSFERDA